MTDLYKVMVHVPSDIGWEDDSFASGWSAGPTGECTISRDGDFMTVALYLYGALTEGYAEKSGLTVDAATYRYMIVCLKKYVAGSNYRLDVYDGSWKTVKSFYPAPDDYDVVVVDMASFTTGTITAVRLYVGQAPSKAVTFDFVAFSKRISQFLQDVMELKVHQRESDVDEFELFVDSRGPVEDDTVLLMHFDEGLGGKTFDESRYENHGVIYGAAWAVGKSLTGLDYDGADDYAEIADAASLDLLKATIVAWIKADAVDSERAIVSKWWDGGQRSWNFKVSNGKLCVDIETTGGISTGKKGNTTLNTGTWYHVAFTWDGATLTFYLNAASDGTPSVSAGNIVPNSANVKIGDISHAGGDHERFNGIIDEVCVFNRALSLSEIRHIYRRGLPYRVLANGRHIRIWLNAVKVFAGIIEDVTPNSANVKASGRCFGQKLLLETSSQDFDAREVSLAVKDFVSGIAEITTFNVDTSSPTVTMTKDYKHEYVLDGLKDCMRQAGNDWEVKLGMGQDLRFRRRSSGSIPNVGTKSESSGHILKGVNKESGAERLFNKIMVVGGSRYNPDNDSDEYTDEDAADWVDDDPDITVADDYAVRVKGKTSISRMSDLADSNPVLSTRYDLGAGGVDLSHFTRVKFYYRTSGITVTKQYDLLIRLIDTASKVAYYKYLDTSQSLPVDWVQYDIALADFTVESGFDWTAVRYIHMRAQASTPPDGVISGIDRWDELCFYTENITKTATDSASSFQHTREATLVDERITDFGFAQEVADALLAVYKSEEKRYRLPITGDPAAQVGCKVTVDSPTNGLNSTYYIVEAEHKVTPRDGYVTELVLEKPRLFLETLLAEAIERKIKTIERGRIT